MKMNIAWLYPDILNLHGDRGNMMAFSKIATSMGIEIELTKIYSNEDIKDINNFDLIYMGAGQLRDMKHIIDDMMTYKDKLVSYVNEGGYLLATGSTGCVLSKGYITVDKDKVKGLGILDMTAKELNRTKQPFVTREVYGDDILFKTADGMEIIGCQIQRLDFTLRNDVKPLGELIYGYGNNCTDGKEGARYKNVLFTNTVGPLLSCNPWLGIKILSDIAEKKGEKFENLSPDKLDYMQYAKKSIELKKNFIRDKSKQRGITYTGC